ncbi:MAG TPA: hypothetical protein VI564_04505 [Candidatus Nanoarchaeia archaeon]|nr:hypothetical protein [Candidatus Nanoarchaeia archaeon]
MYQEMNAYSGRLKPQFGATREDVYAAALAFYLGKGQTRNAEVFFDDLMRTHQIDPTLNLESVTVSMLKLLEDSKSPKAMVLSRDYGSRMIQPNIGQPANGHQLYH